MNVLKGLIMKDLRNIKSYKSTVIFFMVIFFMAGFLDNIEVSFIPIVFTVMFGMMATSSFSYDNLANSDRYVLTFPVTRKDMVKARYCYVLFLTIVGAIVGNILAIVFQWIKIGNMEQVWICLLSTVGSLFGIMVLQMFQIPIMYKFGAEKGRLIQMILFILLTFIISAVTAFFIKVSPFSLEDLGNMLEHYGWFVIGVVVIGLYFVSYKISVGIFSRKEI